MNTSGASNTELAIPSYLHPVQIAALEETRRELLAKLAGGHIVEWAAKGKTCQRVLTEPLLREIWADKIKWADNRLSDLNELNIPEIYLHASADRARDIGAYQRVMTYDPDGDERNPLGIVAYGPTGTGKSSALYARLVSDLLLNRVIASSHISAVQLAELVRELSVHHYPRLMEIVRLLRGDMVGDETDEKLVDRYFCPDCLLIDDLHVPKLTPSYAQVLYAIIEGRTSRGLPLYVTCRMTGDHLLRKLAGDDPELRPTAEAIIRRIAEFCHPVEFR